MVSLGRQVLTAARGDRDARRVLANRVARAVGLRVEPDYHSLLAHRTRLLDSQRIHTVVDAGANIGQYASALRAAGFDGFIESFEPQVDAATSLRVAARSDARWFVHELALGSEPGSLPMFATVDSQSSSLLEPAASNEHYTFLAGGWSSVVKVKRLDDVDLHPGPLMVKLDVQGFELSVLEGSPETLKRTSVVEAELSLVRLYERQAMIEDVVGSVRASGFEPVCLTRGYTHPQTHEVVQVDGLFVRRT
jgi:FkbM family methyltransferase